MPEETSSLAGYIEAAKSHGASDAFLVDMLERSGWPRKEIYSAFRAFYDRKTGIQTPQRVSGFTDAARDAFLYLLSFGTLAVWTWGLGSLFFTLIDMRYPDPVYQNRYTDLRDALSEAMASLIVGFPAYLLTMRVLLRDLSKKPDKLESPVRKWLTYVALLISACTVIGDLVTFVGHLLRGQLTAPFLLKVLTVLAIAGGVFWYYLAPLEKRESLDEP